jgi:membrane fusion protein, heavy metal efflux system
MGRRSITASIIVLSALGVMLGGCSKTRDNPDPVERTLRADVTDNGRTIIFPSASPGLQRIRTVVVKRGSATIPVVTPAHVVASITSGLVTKDKIVLFESPEVTSLYSQYRQARANAERTEKNLARVRDMYESRAATGKDVNDTETEAATTRAAAAESEGKLRELGFNPVELDAVSPGTVWLICDISESLLDEVQQGEEVPIKYASFPNVVFSGHADAVGEVVDPVTRTVKVRVSARNAAGRILPGMFARVDFGDPRDGVVVLTSSAVTTVEGSDYAFVQTGEGRFERRQIMIASSPDTTIVVLKGIEDGDRVVNDGTMLLKGLSFGY